MLFIRVILLMSLAITPVFSHDYRQVDAPPVVAALPEAESNLQNAAIEKVDENLNKSKKDLKEKKSVYKRKLKALKSSAPSGTKYDLLMKIGDCCIDEQEYGDAIQYYSDALRLARADDDKSRTRVKQSLNALAASYVCTRQFDRACPLYDELANLIKEIDGPDDPELFWVSLDLALVYGEQHKTVEREALAPQLLSLLEKRVSSEKEQGESGARPLPFTVWRTPTNKPRCIVLCVHGLGLHSASFDSFAKRLNQENIGVFAIDVRGFGAWQISRAQRVISPERTLHDIDGFLHLLRRYQPNTPIFLLGESMGGAIVLRYVALHQGAVAGAISSVPADKRFNEGGEALRVVLNFFKNKNKRISVVKTLSKAASLNTVPKDLLADPLIRAEFSPEELIKFQVFMKQTAKVANQIESTPVLMLQGMKDKLARPDATIDIYNNIKSEDRNLLLAGDCQHLIFEEVATPPFVTASVLDWLNNHIDKPAENPSHRSTPVSINGTQK